MPTTTDGFRFPAATDTPDAPRDIGNLAADVQSKLGVAVPGAAAGAWQSYAVAWTAATTNPALGNGTLAGAWCKIGRTVFWRVQLVMGSTTTYGSGAWYFSLPTPAVAAAAVSGFPCANWSGTPAGGRSTGTALIDSVTTRAFLAISGGATAVASTAPAVWASGNTLYICGSYESAT